MAIIETTPITNLQGGLIALGVALALLVLRGWLSRPRRSGRSRLLFALSSPVLPARSSDGAYDEHSEGADDEDEVAPGLEVPLDEDAARGLAARYPPPMSARGFYDGRH